MQIDTNSILCFSCCPHGYRTITDITNHPALGYNNSQVVCKHVSLKERLTNETKYCSSGDWTNTFLEKDKYEIGNQNGSVVVKYFGNDTRLATWIYNKKLNFKLNSTYYCVSKCDMNNYDVTKFLIKFYLKYKLFPNFFCLLRSVQL